MTIEKCLNSFHAKERKHVTIPVKLLLENLDFLNDALSSMALQSPKNYENFKIGNIEFTNDYGKNIYWAILIN